jgi:hypothetical protein
VILPTWRSLRRGTEIRLATASIDFGSSRRRSNAATESLCRATTELSDVGHKGAEV